MTTDQEIWLQLTQEEPLEPDLPICDPHHHLWDRPDLPDRPGSRYFLDDLIKDISGGHNILKTVFIDCMAMYRADGPPEMKPIGETEFVQGIAAQSASGQYGPTRVAAGIVSHADLRLGSKVSEVLEAHITASPNRFRGIRHSSVWDENIQRNYMNSPKGLLLDPKFREGFGCLQKYGLSFDAWLYFHQLPELTDLAQSFPETTIILDHIGGPLGIGPYAGQRTDVFRQWRKDIAALSTCNNVYVKLGGLGMPIIGFGWSELEIPPDSVELAEAMLPYFTWCIEKFGVNRCMFESNFPVDKVSYSYNVLWNAFKRIAQDFSSDEKAALFNDTACKAYRLRDN